MFTRALADLLGEGGLVHAVDKDARVLALTQDATLGSARIVSRHEDVTHPLDFTELDGILMANTLHFVSDHLKVLALICSYLRPGGCLLLVEYDDSARSPWVPYPVPYTRFGTLASTLGLVGLRQVGRRASRYGHEDIYAAISNKQ